jgi:hypothetical protein
MVGRSFVGKWRCGPALVTVVVLGSTACSGRAPGTASVRDSAGITVVDNAPPAAHAFAHVATETTLDIGGADGITLDRVSAVLRFPDGRIAVAGQTPRVLVFDAEGHHLLTLGRSGDGPGEFRMLAWLRLLRADSLAAFDPFRDRVSIFAADGRFARTVVPTSRTHARVRTPLLGAFGDGTFLGRVIVPTASSGGVVGLVRPSWRLERFGPDGTFLDSLTTVPGDEIAVVQGVLTRARFARHTWLAVGDTDVDVATSEAFEIRTYDSRGALRRIVRMPWTVLPVTAADLGPEIAGRPQIPEPPTFPAVSGLLLDAAGNIWAQAFDKDPQAPGDWFVFDPNGRLLGDVVMPPRFQPMDVGRSDVLGVWRDSLDVEHVQRHPLLADSGADGGSGRPPR